MAIAVRVKSVDYNVAGFDGDGKPTTIDLSLSGELRVVAEYIDTDHPNDVIIAMPFQVPSTETEQQIVDRMLAYGTKVRDARIRANALQVNIGAVIPLPEATATPVKKQ